MSFQENTEETKVENNQNSDESPVSPPNDHEQVETLKTELENVNAKLLETHNKMLRIAADADNTRKRLEKEKIDTRLYCIQEFARDLLPVIDSFEKALQVIEESNTNSAEPNTHLASITDGVKLVSKIFQDVTKKHGIERISGKGSPFNPMYHNAIAKEVGNEYPVETVIEEFMPGYKIGDRILRTALVKVGAPD